MFDGNVVAVGVEGRTFTDVWEERPVVFEALFVDGKAEEWTELEVEEVEEALECVWTWWMLRIEETDEEVDFRPRRPMVLAEEWRYDERGVSGAGEREARLRGVVTRAWAM